MCFLDSLLIARLRDVSVHVNPTLSDTCHLAKSLLWCVIGLDCAVVF